MSTGAPIVCNDTPLLADDFTEAALMGTRAQRPEEVDAAAHSNASRPLSPIALTSCPASKTVEPDSALATKAIFDDFVRFVQGIPKVWAVYITSDTPVVHIWTFVDSTDWKDRSPVYEAEWQMLIRYPETPFDFNVELAPAGSENFEGEKTAFVFKR
jgi:hypothetical protein